MDRLLTFRYDVFGETYEVKAQNEALSKLYLVKMLEEKSIIKLNEVDFAYFDDYRIMVDAYLRTNQYGTLLNLFDVDNSDLNQSFLDLVNKFDFLNYHHATTQSVNAVVRHFMYSHEVTANDVTLEKVLNLPIRDFDYIRNFGEKSLLQIIKVLSLKFSFSTKRIIGMEQAELF